MPHSYITPYHKRLNKHQRVTTEKSKLKPLHDLYATRKDLSSPVIQKNKYSDEDMRLLGYLYNDTYLKRVYRDNHPKSGSSKCYKKLANRKVRRTNNILSGCEYKKLFDYHRNISGD